MIDFLPLFMIVMGTRLLLAGRFRTMGTEIKL